MDFYITPEEYARAALNGVTKDRLEHRIRESAWDKERAITTPPRKQADRSKWAKLAEENGIPPRLFYNRMSNHGWEPERAATEPVYTQEQKARVMKESNPAKHKYPLEYIELAVKNGIKLNTFRYRVNRLKWSYEDAATVTPTPAAEKGRRGIKGLRKRYGDFNAPIFKMIHRK